MKQGMKTAWACVETVRHSTPFDWEEVLRYLTRSSEECLWRVESRRVKRLLAFGDVRVLVDIGWQDGEIEIHMYSDHLVEEGIRAAVRDYVVEWFDLARDLAPFYEQMSQCAIMNPIVKRFAGLRLVGVADLFEALCWAIIGQQINLGFAYTLKRRLVESFGEKATYEGQDYWLFPSPATFTNVEIDTLRGLQLTQRKAEYIREVARLMTEGTLRKEALVQLGDREAVVQTLVSIRGIGPWTAHYVAMRCLRDLSAFPVQDVGLQQAVQLATGIDRKPTIAELQAFSARWKGWEAYATFYLWHSLAEEGRGE